MTTMDRVMIIKKYAGKKTQPTAQEIKEAYGYLDYCLECGRKITLWDRLTFNVVHNFMGNTHRRNC